MSGACTCCPGETYMGETPHLARHAAGFLVVLLRPLRASGDSYLAVATFCLHRRREAVRVLMDCRLTTIWSCLPDLQIPR